MDIVYGIQVAEKNDRYIPAAEDFVERISAASLPGAFLVDAFPARASLLWFSSHLELIIGDKVRHIPRWFPGAEFLKLASQFRTLSEEVMEEPMREVERTMVRSLRQKSRALSLTLCRLLGPPGPLSPLSSSIKSKAILQAMSEGKSRR